ncbi:unnamed protein product [Cyprideis torosa]|uniref:Uncharacterized protein n=1 Tax=Cyprideis torosa TaxID=163714 RepID=A0A7R8WBX9_9CRUS|nr:unnamed protein product [Cyprideis torosa]CAG0892804.1 unnamed protein product [Cyprideis torosa]
MSLFLFFILAIFSSSNAKTCNHPFEETPGGKCLFNPMGVLELTWDEGQRICRWMNENGHLVEFQSYEELQDVTGYLNEHYGSCSHWPSVEWMDKERDNVLPILCEMPPRAQCPPEFIPVGETCYYLGNTTFTWDNAQEFCKVLAPHGKLAELETTEEIYAVTEFLLSNGNDRHYRIGAEERGQDNSYEWASSGKPVFVTNWYNGYAPDSGTDDTILLNYSFKYRWNDSPRTNSYYVLCEADPADLS